MRREELEKILNSFKEEKIAVVGDIMLDRFRYGPDERISPEEPGTVVIQEKSVEEKLGGAGNVAMNIISLGGSCYFFGVVGEDDYGTRLEKLLNASGIERCILLKDKRRTTVKERIIATRENRKRQVIRIDREDSYDINFEISCKILKALKQNINNIDGIILQDYGKGLLTDYLIDNIVNEMNLKGIPIFVDPKNKLVKNASIFKPNKRELSRFSGIEDIEGACKKLFKEINPEYLVVTAGDEGIYTYNQQGLRRIPTVARDVVDVMGAGDTVIASLALSYVSKKNIYDACDIANHAASVAVGKIGTATVTIGEIKKSFLDNGIYGG